MKSIEDYVHLEPKYYEAVLQNYEDLFAKQIGQINNNITNVVIYATGSSSNAAYGALPFMSNILKMPVKIEEPSIAENYLLHVEPNSLCIAISQGGHSYSVVKIIQRLQDAGNTVFALTSKLDSPVGKVCHHVLDMGMPIEEMPYVSAGYSVEILDLLLLAMLIAQKTGKLSSVEFTQILAEIKNIVQKMPEVIKRASSWVENNISKFATAKRLVFIGYGATYGVSREGETKTTEAVRISAWGKELEEYMHGPYLGLNPDDFIICLDPMGKLHDRMELLKRFLNKHVKNVYTIYASKDESATADDLSLGITTSELLASLFMTVPVHLLAYKLSQVKKIDLQHSAYPDFDQITASKI